MVKPAEVRDLEALANLAVLLWENHSAEDLLYEFTKIMSHGEAQFFVKYVKDVPSALRNASCAMIMWRELKQRLLDIWKAFL